METDPFLTGAARGGAAGTRARGANKYDSGSGMMAGAYNLILMPWITFCTITLLYAFVYHHFREVVWLASLGFVALAAIFISLSARMDGKWYTFLGILTLIAVVAGNIVGVYIYSQFFLQYWAYDMNRTYTNVLPSEPAAAHADAGIIKFAASARIDTTKAVGYKSGKVYCVAPVMDETQTSRVEYWAAGYDCCKQRADFTCDEAANPTARQGVVIFDANSWFFTSRREYYELAVKQAEAAYDIVSAPNPIFVRWVAAGEEVQNEFAFYGRGFLYAAAAVYLLVSVVLGVACSMSSKRQARDPRATG
jgi:hypothetical protein